MSDPTELPDLDKLEAYATRSKSGDWHATEAMLNMLDEDDVLALVAAARRAKPEGEAPQAVYQFRATNRGDWIECDAGCHERLKVAESAHLFEFRTLYTAPAAQQAAAPSHETIVREGSGLVCTACGTSAPGTPEAPVVIKTAELADCPNCGSQITVPIDFVVEAGHPALRKGGAA